MDLLIEQESLEEQAKGEVSLTRRREETGATWSGLRGTVFAHPELRSRRETKPLLKKTEQEKDVGRLILTHCGE